MPARVLLCAVLLVVATLAAVSLLRGAEHSRAHIVPGEYSMEVDVAPAQVALGDTFTATVGVFHNEPGGYASAQWHVNYDPAVVTVLSMGTHPGAPPECASDHDDGTRVLLGCLTFVPNGFTYSGPAMDIVFSCDANGVTPLTLIPQITFPPETFVATNGPGPIAYQPSHVHNDSVECSDAVPTNTPAVPTPTSVPITAPRGGTWQLSVDGPAEKEVGESFVSHIAVTPADSLGYRWVQWGVDYDATRLQRINVQASGAAPPECAGIGGTDPFIVGCFTTATNGLTHSGAAFEVLYTCIAPGPAVIALNAPGIIPFESILVTGEVDNEYTEAISVNSVTVNCLAPLPFNGLVKTVDGEMPAEGESTFRRNLWLCADQSADGIDNDGDSTADNEAATCDGNGEGALTIEEVVFANTDCDTSGDDDDGDGRPIDGSVADGSRTSYIGSDPRPECRQPTLDDFVYDRVDKDGGEVPEGLGAIEFQLKFDHKVFDISVTPSDNKSDGIDNDGDTLVDEADEDWANGRFVNCSMSIITENDIRFGCVSSGTMPGQARPFGTGIATIAVMPEADLPFRLRPTKDNGVARRLLDENCEVADIFGDIFPHTNAGLTPGCTDVDLTVRRLEGDVDMDCDVDVNDAQRTAFRYGSFFGHLAFDQNYDLEPWPTADFDIDIKDLQFVFGRDGSNCRSPIPDNQHPIAAGGVGQP